ncbi:hypothetical protein, partial [Corynebacterium diphtheriae]|uniref:hypothetical protein n=1 Tax=Corynebacterium diphtheriae TaxID=1717 RepID=UPI001C501277
KSSMNNYNQFKTTVLQPPIESKVLPSTYFPVSHELKSADHSATAVGIHTFCFTCSSSTV